MNRGRFIVIEGIDGAGTTTQAGLVAKALAAAGADGIHTTAEPTGGPVGTLIRHVLRGAWETNSGDGTPRHFDRRALALLFAADRLDHLAREIEPNLANGRHVISDRYFLSSLAYQGLDAPSDWITLINGFAPAPDLLVFLDVSVDEAARRIANTRELLEIFEVPHTLRLVDAAYRKAILTLPQDRILVVDGTLAREDITRQIVMAIARD